MFVNGKLFEWCGNLDRIITRSEKDLKEEIKKSFETDMKDI